MADVGMGRDPMSHVLLYVGLFVMNLLGSVCWWVVTASPGLPPESNGHSFGLGFLAAMAVRDLAAAVWWLWYRHRSGGSGELFYSLLLAMSMGLLVLLPMVCLHSMETPYTYNYASMGSSDGVILESVYRMQYTFNGHWFHVGLIALAFADLVAVAGWRWRGRRPSTA